MSVPSHHSHASTIFPENGSIIIHVLPIFSRYSKGTQAAAAPISKHRPSEHKTEAAAVTRPDPLLVGKSEQHQIDEHPPRNPETKRRPRPRHGETRNHTAVARPHTIIATANYKHTKCPALLKSSDLLEGSQDSLGSSQDSLGSVQESPRHTPRILLTTPGNTKYYCEGKVTTDIGHEQSHSTSMPTLFTKDKKLTPHRPPLSKRTKKCNGRVKLPPLSIPCNSPLPIVQRQRSFSDPDIKLPRLIHL